MAASMDWTNAPPASNSAAAPPFRPPGAPEGSQQFMGPNGQQYRATPPYPPQMAMRPNQPMAFNQPPQPGMYPASVPPFPPQGGAYPASYQVGSQGQLYPLNAGQTNTAPGIPQGYLSGANVDNVGRSLDWQEHVAPDGRRYYYNKRTKLSSWEKPEDLMSSTERADASTVWKEFTTQDNKKYYYNKLTKQSTWTMPEEMRLAREQAQRSLGNAVGPRPEASPAVAAPQAATASPAPSLSPAVVPAATASAFAVATPSPAPAAVTSQDSAATDAVEDEGEPKDMPVEGVTPPSTLEERPTPVDEPVYVTKLEAKNAFKELLESVHVQSDWTWDQTMRMIINDKRYGAVKTLGERKQAFNEYLAQRKKLDIEEKRLKQKKAREDFLKMLEESQDLTSSMRWSKVASMFEHDPRYHAVEKERDREDLFDDYLTDLERKEREKAREEKKKNRAEFRALLESCDFIKVNSQWRKIQDRLEDDERCTRLDKLDRLEVFQEYIRDLEKEEDEEKRIQKEQLRRKERKNRDEFRGLLEMHKAQGILVARTHWREYLVKVKEHPAYQAVAMNASGSTPKDLFVDAIEELEKQYQEDKARIKDVMKMGKIAVVATSTYDEFRAGLAEAGDIGTIPESNIKLAFEECMDRIKEKEEKEAKKRRRLTDDFSSLLRSNKAITTTSSWDELKPTLEETAEYRAIGDEAAVKKIFEDHLNYLQQKGKDKERKRDKDDKSKNKEEKDKERRKEKSSSKKDKDEEGEEKKRDKKHKRRHRSGSSEDGLSDDDSRKSRRHGHEHRKSSRRHGHDSDSEAEAKPKRQKKERNKPVVSEELEDGEVGEDGEIR